MIFFNLWRRGKEYKQMSGRTIAVTLPEVLYERVKITAEASARSVEDVRAHSIALSLPELEGALPPPVRLALAALSLQSDAKLQNIAHSRMNEEQRERLEALAEVQKQRALTVAEESTLTHFMEEAEHLMLRKAEAYRLLARRGHTVFSPYSGKRVFGLFLVQCRQSGATSRGRSTHRRGHIAFPPGTAAMARPFYLGCESNADRRFDPVRSGDSRSAPHEQPNSSASTPPLNGMKLSVVSLRAKRSNLCFCRDCFVANAPRNDRYFLT
jgi:predicted DNA-binding protein